MNINLAIKNLQDSVAILMKKPNKETSETIEENKREIEARANDMDLQIAMAQIDTEFLMCLEELNEEGGE